MNKFNQRIIKFNYEKNLKEMIFMSQKVISIF